MLFKVRPYLVLANSWLQQNEIFLLGTTLIAYFIISLATSWLLVQQYQIGKMDTALYQTSLWQAGQFRNPVAYITYAMAGIPTHPFIGLHFMPMGFFYGLIYRFAPGMYTTAVLYSFFFTLAGYFVYRSVRLLTKNVGIALLFTPIAPHFYPIEDWSAAYAAAALYFFICRRYGWASAAFLLLMMSKEYFGLTVAAFGGIIWLTDTYYAARRMHNLKTKLQSSERKHFSISYWIMGSKQKIWGLVWMIGGLLWFGISFFGVMHSAEPNWVNAYMFQAVGGSAAGVLETLRADPFFLFQRLTSTVGLHYMLGLLLPFSFLSLIGFEYVFAAAPIIVINFIADPTHTVPEVVSHYTIFFLPFMVIGAAVGFVRVIRWSSRWSRTARWILVSIFTLFICTYALEGIYSFAYRFRSAITYSHTLALHAKDVQKILSLIPPTASVSGDDNLLPYVAERAIVTNLNDINLETFKPEFIIRDALDGSAIRNIQSRGHDLGFSLFRVPSSQFYDQETEMLAPPASCGCAGYSIFRHAGSLALYKRNQ
jgi:hypothetical protein